MSTDSLVPAPDADALEHGRLVRAEVERRIEVGGGFLGFADFMDCVLYAPGLGYYSAGTRKFGPGGDFVTAPEIGPAFARCVARVVGRTLRGLGGGSVLELGAGSGALAADLLESMRTEPPERYLILEVSAALRERQRATVATRVPDLLSRVHWLDELPREPFVGVIFGNEVLDALPCERFRVDGAVVYQVGVQSRAGRLAPTERAAPAPLARAIADLRERVPLADGYRGELNLRMPALLASLAEVLGRGIVLWFDYGGTEREVYHAERDGGTLVGYHRHRRIDDPLQWPGLLDLSAWVDFSAAARASRAAGLEVLAYGTQAHFLLAAGILDTPPEDSLRSRAAGAHALQRLLLPGEQGETFKLLACGQRFAPAEPLTVRDFRAAL